MNKITMIIPLGSGNEIEGIKEIRKQKIDHISISGPNPSKNRNNGAKKAKTDLIAFINGHTTLNKDWKEKVEQFFKEHPEIDIVGGPQLSPKKASLFQKASDYALTTKFGAAGASKRYKPGKLDLNADETMITSANLICKRKVLEKVQFDETIYPGEDPKFIEDCKKKGFKIAYDPKIIVYNKRRDKLNKFFVQIYMYGFMRTKKEPLFKTLKRPMFLIPSLFVLYIVALLISFFIIGPKFVALIPLIAYGLLAFLFSLNKKLFLIPLIFICYIIIHVSYGLGFIVGAIKKNGR